MSKLYDNKVIDFKTEPLFLGSGRNINRDDEDFEPWIKKHTTDSLSLMWFHGDFSYSDDSVGYNSMGEELQWMFKVNNNFQHNNDSLITRSILELFLPITTSPHLEQLLYSWSFFESIHTRSYPEILKSVDNEPSKTFDDILKNTNIQARTKDIMVYLEDLYQYNALYIRDNENVLDKMKEMTKDNGDFAVNNMIGFIKENDLIEVYDKEVHKEKIIKAIYAINVIEGMLFETSFLVSFAFSENNLMKESVKAISKIAIDESMHLVTTQYLINRLKKDNDWKYIFVKIEDEMKEFYKKCYEADLVWVDYLFSKGAKLMGLNANILKEYSKYNTYRRMKKINLPQFLEETDNPCLWARKYVDRKNTQTAVNETTNSAYLLGVIDTMVSNDAYSKFLN